MDDDLPKEGELLDISKKKSSANTLNQNASLASSEKKPTSLSSTAIVVVVLLVVGGIALKFMPGGSVDPEKLAAYKRDSQSIFDTMKAQFPNLVSVSCEGSSPDKADCVNFVGYFKPNKNGPNFLASMDTNDKAYGASQTDIVLIKDQIGALVSLKRMTLTSVRKPLTFLIDSVNITRDGQESEVKIKCTEDTKDTVVCLSDY